MGRIDLSVIILSYNTKNLLENCLTSVHLIPNTEIIVVDNASADGSPQMVKEKFPDVKLIVNKQNLGFAKGNNLAVRQVSGELILFLNSDTIVQPGAVETLVDYLNKNPQVAAVSPLLLNEDGTVQKDPCYLKFPSPIFVLIYYNKFLKILAENFSPKILFSTVNFNQLVSVDQLPGAALMIRKNIFEKIGGFDEDFGHFFEDVDLSWRLKKSEHHLVLVPQAKIIHLGRKSLEPKVQKEGIETFYYLNFKSLFQFCRKNYPFYKTLLIEVIIFCCLLFRFRFGLMKRIFF